jgi:hypothetical protein
MIAVQMSIYILREFMIQDGFVFFDSSNGKKMIFNHYSYCEYVKWNIVRFANRAYEEASDIVNNSFLADKIDDDYGVYFLTHEIPYHWAMLLVHGDMYWQKDIPYPEPCSNDDILNWERELSLKYNLKTNTLEDCS